MICKESKKGERVNKEYMEKQKTNTNMVDLKPDHIDNYYILHLNELKYLN